MTHSPKNRINASIFMRIDISRILHNSFAITWGNLGSDNLSTNTNYQLICTEELYMTLVPLEACTKEEACSCEFTLALFGIYLVEY